MTIARLVIKPVSTGGPSNPRLALASQRGAPAGTLVVAMMTHTGPATFVATVVVVRPIAAAAPTARPPGSARLVSLRLSAGFSLAEPPRVVKDVLYANSTPPFGIVEKGNTSVLMGESPSKLTIDRIVRDAQLLAHDRSVPLVDMGLLGLPFVACQFTRTGNTIHATFVVSWLSPVSGIELRFPTGTTVTKVSGPPETDGLPMESAAQLIGSTGAFKVGQAYAFTVTLSRAPRKGEFVTLRASAHYFESSLPFTERFAFG